MLSIIFLVTSALMFLYNLLDLGTDLRLEWPFLFLVLALLVEGFDLGLHRRRD